MSYNLSLFNKSPEKVLEEAEEIRPRQYAKDIFMRYPESERMAQVDRLVPVHFRNMVREYLTDWAARAKVLGYKTHD